MKQTSMILACSVALLFCAACTAKKEVTAKPAVPVKVAQSQQKDVPLQIKAIGNIEAYTSVAIKSQVNGQIARVHFREGSDVAKGDLLISLDPEPFLAIISQCEAALAKDQSQVKFAREQAKRYEELVREGIVTRDQYDLLRTTADSFAASVAADRAAIKSARIQLSYCSIRSPVSGRTGIIALQPGNLVKSNDLPIVTVNQISPIYATFSVPEKRLAEVKRAMAGNELRIEALVPNEPGGREVGTISFLDNAVNAATGTIKLKGVFENKSRRLWPGQFTDVLMTLGTSKNAVTIPTNALQTSQQGQFVYVVRSDSKVEMRPVTTATVIGEETVIEKGLAVGETVVTDGQLRLVPGARVVSGSEQQAAGKKE